MKRNNVGLQISTIQIDTISVRHVVVHHQVRTIITPIPLNKVISIQRVPVLVLPVVAVVVVVVQQYNKNVCILMVIYQHDQ
jgi:hypothetical protein